MVDWLGLISEYVIVADQAILAAIVEESVALNTDKDGFRDGEGRFRSKKYAIARSAIGVGLIALIVKFVPVFADMFFTHPLLQSIGLGIVGGVVLVNTAVESWNMFSTENIQEVSITDAKIVFERNGYHDYKIFTIGLILLIFPSVPKYLIQIISSI